MEFNRGHDDNEVFKKKLNNLGDIGEQGLDIVIVCVTKKQEKKLSKFKSLKMCL